MFLTVCAALAIAVRIASSTLVGLLPTISLNLYTWSLTGPPRRRSWLTLARAASPRARFRYVSAGPDVRSSCSPEYVGQRTAAALNSRKLLDVPHRRPKEPPMTA